MDHTALLKKAISEESLRLALDHSIYDRIKRDFFYNPIEINYAIQNKDRIISELLFELNTPENYQQRTAFCYFPPKTKLTFRRLIYIPIKDLAVRYSFVKTISDYIDGRFSKNCFSNRLERKNPQKYFLQDYAVLSYPKWCKWQKVNCESDYVLLKTDITSFYDSISHDYLIEAISKEMEIPIDCRFLKIFNSILKVPLVSYSTKNKNINIKNYLKQGLATGSGCDGFLANVYLKDSDDLMRTIKGIKYGRYVDDIRIFARKRINVLNAIKILQENLLGKGLNLNGAKTELAEDKQTKMLIVSKGSPSMDIEDDEYVNIPRINTLIKKVDKDFYEFNEKFKAYPDFLTKPEQKESRAKDYCKFMSTKDENGENSLLKLNKRTEKHILALSEIISKWQGASKHAVWLLAESAFFDGVLTKTQDAAIKAIINLLSSNEVSSYGKYRLLHHLLKIRNNDTKDSFLMRLPKVERRKINDKVGKFLSIPSLELNIITLVLMFYKYKRSAKKVREIATNHFLKNENLKEVPHFIQESLEYMESINMIK